MTDYVLSHRAASDLSAIADYGFSNFGVAQSRNYGEGLEECLGQLANTPLLGVGAERLAGGLRRYKFGSHWIFYLERTEGIRVVRVLHESMDFVRHL
jgi:toxin ParE1/3/4